MFHGKILQELNIRQRRRHDPQVFGPNQTTNVVSGSTNGPYSEFTIDPMTVKFTWNFMRSTNQPPPLPNLAAPPPPAAHK